MSLDGVIGTTATAELDGNGHTGLVGVATWQLVRLPAGSVVSGYAATTVGISLLAGTTDKYVVSFIRPSPEGDYALRWITPQVPAGLDESFTSYTTVPTVAGFVPTVDDVGALIRTRTKDQFGNELGTFNANTRPTDAQVTTLIDQAYDYVTARTDTDLPAESWRAARSAIATKAAMLVELGYWPDQIPTNQSPYEQLRVEFEAADGQGGQLAGLMASINRENEELIEGETPQSNSPQYSFPSDNQTYMKRTW